jgi:hypothetical protein
MRHKSSITSVGARLKLAALQDLARGHYREKATRG